MNKFFYQVLRKYSRTLQPCSKTYSHTWWWKEWPDFASPRRWFCAEEGTRNIKPPFSFSPNLSRHQSRLWMCSPWGANQSWCCSLTFSVFFSPYFHLWTNPPIRSCIYSAILFLFPPQRLAPFYPSLLLSLLQPFLLPPLLFIFPHLRHPCRHRGSSPSRGTVIRTGRELAVRQTNSELGHHCLCVRGPLSRWKASRQEEQVTLNPTPGRFWATDHAESKLYVISRE